MSVPRIIFPLFLLAPALTAAQPQAADQQPAAAANVIQRGAAQSLAVRFFGGPSALEQTSVPPAGTAAPLAASRKSAPAPQAAAGERVPADWSFTPGKLCTPSDPDFSEYRYAEQIPYCRRHVTQQMKQEIAAHYGIPQNDWSDYEFDHLIPLAVGGDSYVDNVWPQPHGDPDGSNGKDRLEMQLYQQMKAGTMKQTEAIQQIQLWFEGRSEVDGGSNLSTAPIPPGLNPAD